jgi:hypothetical protein
MLNEIINRLNLQDGEFIEFQKIPLTIAATGTTYNIASGTKTNPWLKRVVGLALNTTDETGLVGSTIKLYIDNVRYFDGEEAKLLYGNYAVPPSQRFYHFINQEVKEVDITGYYASGSAGTPTYYVNFYLMCIRNRQ